MQDDGAGTIYIYKVIDGVKIIVHESIGTVDYTTGSVIIPQFLPTAVPAANNGYVHIYALPLNNDVTPVRNQIIVIEDGDISINMIDEKSGE
jgi:hypothetical protein